MIQPDSIEVLNDSTSVLSDSLARVDSLHLADSLKTIIHTPTGFLGIPHPSFPQTENWVFIVLVLFFFLLVYSSTQSIGLISDTIKTFFQVKERSSIFSKATVNDSRFRFFIEAFAIGVLSFYAYLIFYKSINPFSLKQYGLFLLVTVLFFGMKSLIFDVIGYVFLNPAITKMGKDAYFNIVSFWGAVLFPILCLEIYIPDRFVGITQFISLIISITAAILIIIKLFQIFFRKLLASFYILLYLCTLEFLPLIILLKVYGLIV